MPPSEPQQAEPASPTAGLPADKYLLIPGYWALNMDSVQKELRLTAEQRQQLKAISAKYQAAVEAFQAESQKGLAECENFRPRNSRSGWARSSGRQTSSPARPANRPIRRWSRNRCGR